MNRKEKYPDTSVFHFHNENPKGRITGDCTFRAIARATGKSWEEVVREMAEMSIKTGYAVNDKKGIEKYMESIGWIKMPQPRRVDGTKYTGAEFAKKNLGNRIVCMIGGHHVTCIIMGKVNDIWDCTNKCVGNYWVKG
jgi:hypothetical protein